MPWDVVQRGEKWCVIKISDESTVACHDSKPQADKQRDALYANYSGKLEQAALDVQADVLASTQEPYGDVKYADPGYRGGVKRYPIDCEHVQAAWSYIHQPKNRRFYTSSQLTAMEGKIRAAMKRCGHQVSEASVGLDLDGLDPQWFDALMADLQEAIADPQTLGQLAQERDVNIPGPGGHNLRHYWTRGAGAAKVGWGTHGDFARCEAQLRKYVRDPKGLCAEYHHIATGTWPGPHAHEPGRADADMQTAAVEDCAPCAAALADQAQADPELSKMKGPAWEGVLAVEDTPTGDGRVYAAGGFEFAPMPMPLMFQPANQGQHTGSAMAGRIDEIWRDGNKIRARGIFDAAGTHGAEAYRQVDGGFLKGVSVDLDSIKPNSVEYLYASDTKPHEGNQSGALQPEGVRVPNSRIRGATLVQFPAFVEASIWLVKDDKPHTLTAAGHTIELADLPPAQWFEEPTDVQAHGALTVTDQGRVYGYLATAGVPHRSYPDRWVEVPRGNVDYSKFLGGQTVVEGGARVATGPITMDCGHAAVQVTEAARRRQHYDNTCSVVGSIRIGENSQGVWVAGAVYPSITAEQIHKMLACRLSGDWIDSRERVGQREFVAALLVPVPGFATARTQASLSLDDRGLLTAAAIPVEFEQPVPQTGAEFSATVARLARQLGVDRDSQLAALANRMGFDLDTLKWNPDLHPRGPGGRFVKKGLHGIDLPGLPRVSGRPDTHPGTDRRGGGLRVIDKRRPGGHPVSKVDDLRAGDKIQYQVKGSKGFRGALIEGTVAKVEKNKPGDPFYRRDGARRVVFDNGSYAGSKAMADIRRFDTPEPAKKALSPASGRGPLGSQTGVAGMNKGSWVTGHGLEGKAQILDTRRVRGQAVVDVIDSRQRRVTVPISSVTPTEPPVKSAKPAQSAFSRLTPEQQQRWREVYRQNVDSYGDRGASSRAWDTIIRGEPRNTKPEPAGRTFTAKDLNDVLGKDQGTRSVDEHRRLLEEAGATRGQSEKILQGFGADTSQGHLTKDLGAQLHMRLLAEQEAAKLTKKRETLKAKTQEAYDLLLGDSPNKLTYKPVRQAFEAMRQKGWVLSDLSPSASTWTSPDGRQTIRMFTGAGNPVLYDADMKRLSGKRALELVNGS